MILRSRLSTVALLMFGIFILTPVTSSAFFWKKKVPAWVTTQLSDPNYYIRVGSAPLDKKYNSHIEEARKDALNELASEISVQIFSSNVLVSVVRNDELKDEFNSLIRARVVADIEGYELVDTYQDRKNYWSLYRLSKQRYAEGQQRKRADAVEDARFHYVQAAEAEAQRNYRQAVIASAKAIDALKAYLNESHLVTISGREVNLVQQSFARIAAVLSTLRVYAAENEIEARYAGSIGAEQLSFLLTDSLSNPVPFFPVAGWYSERALSGLNRITDEFGIVAFEIPKVRSNKARETFTLAPDIQIMLVESSADFTVRKAILEMAVQKSTVPVKVSKPSVQIEVKSSASTGGRNTAVVYNSLRALFLNKSFPVVRDSSDLRLELRCFPRLQSKVNDLCTVTLEGSLRLFDSYGNLLYTQQIAAQKGVQLTEARAEEEAYNALVRQLESRYFREMEEALLK